LLIATLAVSFAAILIRMSDAHAFVIAFWRLAIATVAMLGIGTVLGKTSDLRRIRADREFLLLVISGFFLAVHFASWTLSLEYTSVAASVAIVDSSPIIVAILSLLILKESVSKTQITGIVLAVVGAAIIGLVDSSGTESLFGNALAFIGAAAVAVYLIIGRTSRTRLSTFSYVIVVYGFCAFFLLVASFSVNASIITDDLSQYLLFLLLALGPSCLGHSLYNYALGHIRAPIVSTTTLGEAVGSTILAVFILSEIPGPIFVVGAFILFAGVILTLEPWKETINSKYS